MPSESTPNPSGEKEQSKDKILTPEEIDQKDREKLREKQNREWRRDDIRGIF